MKRALAAASVLVFGAGCRNCAAPEPGAAPDAAADASPSEPINATPLPTASVEAALNPDKYPIYDGPTGSVEGTVSVTGATPAETPADFSKCPSAADIWGHAFREGPETPGGGRALVDAVVAVTGYKRFYIPAKSEAEALTIEGCGYASRTLAVTFGQRIDVKNASKDFWIPFLKPGSTTVMMMATPGGDPVKLYPKRPGRMLVEDRDRPYATADVYVFLFPLHTVTDRAGHYRLDGLPVGKVKLSTRHPQIEAETSVDLDVQAGVIAHVDLSIANVPREAGAPKRADGGPPPIH